MSKKLREAIACVTSGNAKMGEVEYGDDGVDMAEDMRAVFDDCDRYRAALERIARLEDFVDAHHAPAIAREALAGGKK